MLSLSVCLLAPLLISFAAAASSQSPSENRSSTYKRDGSWYSVFHHAATGSRTELVHNSCICETSPGVDQYSGYFSTGGSVSMWFWFFEARENPSTAPLAAWFNGGPGCSSMVGLFQENGPCHFVDGETVPSINEYSWNNNVNMLYIDQPAGVGFSYGSNVVNSTDSAAPYVWRLLQAFYAQFPKYKSREFAIFTESYGGHYGPEFAFYFEKQNNAINYGSAEGEYIDLVALGISDGWIDAALQEKAYIDYSYSNPYRQVITTRERSKYMEAYHNDCLPAIQNCAQTGSDNACFNADTICIAEIEYPITIEANFNIYDIRQPSNDPNPPKTYISYLQNQSVMEAIGAKSPYQECSNVVEQQFRATGDSSRTFLPELSRLVQRGITVLIWAGDADWICNWVGNHAVTEAIFYAGQEAFQDNEMVPYTVNGTQRGLFKSVGNLSFLRVFNAGHEVPYYQPETALQAFSQTVRRRPIFST